MSFAAVCARTVIALALIAVGGCARAMLPYTPDQQPQGARVSAAYHTLIDQLRIEIDTDGRRLEQAWIRKPDGSHVAAIAIESPPMAPPTVDIGISGGTFGRGSGVATGVGIGIPFGSSASRTPANTIVTFPLATVGPGPWPVYIKLAGIPAITIVVGGPPTAR
jgi:hypothetical protein